jgi:hypothetical protein
MTFIRNVLELDDYKWIDYIKFDKPAKCEPSCLNFKYGICVRVRKVAYFNQRFENLKFNDKLNKFVDELKNKIIISLNNEDELHGKIIIDTPITEKGLQCAWVLGKPIEHDYVELYNIIIIFTGIKYVIHNSSIVVFELENIINFE